MDALPAYDSIYVRRPFSVQKIRVAAPTAAGIRITPYISCWTPVITRKSGVPHITAYPIPPNMIRISIGSIHTIPDTATVWNDVSKCADTHSTTAHNAVSARQSAPSERKTKERMGFIVTG